MADHTVKTDSADPRYRKITVRQVDNAGVIVSLGELCVCMDILCEDGRGLYMTASGETEQLILKNSSLKPDICLITHEHCDHFSAEKMREFAFFRPNMPIVCNRATADCLRPYVTNPILAVGAGDGLREYRVGDARLLGVYCTHAGEQYSDVENLCFCLEYRDCRVLFAGDAAPDALLETVGQIGIKPDLLICPFAYLTLKSARERLMRELSPRHIFVMHLPAPERDAGGWLDILDRVVRSDLSLPDVRYDRRLGKEYIFCVKG